METFAYKTLGCKVNQYEGDVARDLLEEAGLVEVGGGADLVLLNTCAVTERAVQKARQALRRLRRENPEAVTVVTGCMTPGDIPRFHEIAPTAHLALNRRRGETRPLLRRLAGRGSAQSHGQQSSSRRTRAFLKVQDGCRLRCTYCIIPQMRGPGRSRPLSEVLAEFRALEEAGCPEVVLCGIHLGHWGLDLTAGAPESSPPEHHGPIGARPVRAPADRIPQRLEVADLTRGLLAECRGEIRLRLSSLEINEISERLLDQMRVEPALVDHLHIPLQSGSEAVLRRMRRPYTAAVFEKRLEAIRNRIPDVAITTDLIVGFPGETDEEFQETLDLVRRAGFSKIHIFPFSPRAGTPAALLPDRVTTQVVRRRLAACRRMERQLRSEFNRRLLGRVAHVVPEGRLADGRITGITEHYQRVVIEPLRTGPLPSSAGSSPGRNGTTAGQASPSRAILPAVNRSRSRLLKVRLVEDRGSHLSATLVNRGEKENQGKEEIRFATPLAHHSPGSDP